ncbi:hypothetical protein CDV31_006690 [Fusarium ambrosium]|uniref:F-box domain-containing protein n=1 Tax=Fusarium ambrosium TaxID=131363 RepID=A0A428UBE2_9HYPO|nr:hypothetical protein CDV31_006690 [Fusarium ambrosium]
MAAAALVSGPGPIRIVPAGVANVQRLPGSDYGILGLDEDAPLSTRLPYEIMQQIYLYLTPEDFNAARYTSRSWFRAGLCPSLLVEMLKRGGWWSSLQQISEPLRITRPRNTSDQERLMTGADIRHGVRVVATFSVNGGDGMQLDSDEVATGCGSGPQKVMDMDADKQMIRSEGSYGDIDFTGDPSSEATAKAYPLEIRGQAVAICSNLVELALDSGPDMVLWAFSAQGWARAWALHAGREDAFNHTVVQQDGSLRQVDREGDYAMAQVDQTSAASGVDGKGLDGGHVSTGTTFGWNQPGVERDRSTKSGEQGDGMDGTVSVELVEEVNGIARIEVELR